MPTLKVPKYPKTKGNTTTPQMDVLGGGGGLFWYWKWTFHSNSNAKYRPRATSKSAASSDVAGSGEGWDFPLKPAVTAAALALAGDTIAQIRMPLKTSSASSESAGNDNPQKSKDFITTVLESHDWFRALRMVSYGFLLYGPGSYAWYQFLDRRMPLPTLTNISIKVLLNQIVLGPCVIAVVFAWNNLWQNKLAELPDKYRKDALPALLYGFRFWIPASVLNFGVIPLQARVAFMSTCAVFWNFYLSSTMSK